MKIFFILIFYCISIPVFAQRNLKIVVKDFNQDGFVDSLKTFYEGGSSSGGRYISIKNGKTNELLELENFSSFSEIKNIALIPSNLQKAENQKFLEEMKKYILPKQRKKPDPSLEWIINGTYSNWKLDRNKYFNYIINPKTAWQKGKFKIPENYFIPITGDSLKKLLDDPYVDSDALKPDSKGFLIYYAHNHLFRNDSISCSNFNETYKIYKTKHGIIAQKGNLYKWLFVTDYSLTESPYKLRWASIDKIALIENYIILKQDLPIFNEFNIYIINIETGICGRLKHPFTNKYLREPAENGFDLINKNEIKFCSEKEILIFQTQDLFEILDKENR